MPPGSLTRSNWIKCARKVGLTSYIAEANLPSRSDSPAMVAAQIHVEPTDDDGHGTV